MRSATEGTVAAIAATRAIITEISGTSNAIAAAVEQQDVATQEIARAVREAVREPNEVSETVTAMAADTAGVGSSAQQMRDGVDTLSRHDEALRTMLSQFHIGRASCTGRVCQYV